MKFRFLLLAILLSMVVLPSHPTVAVMASRPGVVQEIPLDQISRGRLFEEKERIQPPRRGCFKRYRCRGGPPRPE
ncbi:hypothetical protein U1Q18_042175 [Sarracenia purpurea var. burkii]